MSAQDRTQTSSARARGELCVLLAADPTQEQALRECLSSLAEHTPPAIEVLRCEPSAAAVNEALAGSASADVVLLSEACLLSDGWLGRLGDAAWADGNTATASALSDAGGELSIGHERLREGRLAAAAAELLTRTLALRPGLSRPAGPCIYLRRDALELLGPLDERLELGAALVELGLRAVLSGLGHVAADDVLVAPLASSVAHSHAPPELIERYPYLGADAGWRLGTSAVLGRALAAVRSDAPLSVTVDARALDGALTGTHVHILELIQALAATGAVRLRLLIRERRIDPQTLGLLASLPSTELLAEERLDAHTPTDDLFHRPQQAFAAEDVELALRLGGRLVLSQLDLIAYRNPGYFPDAGAWAAYRRAGRHGMAAAERVLVFSEQTRRELLAESLVGAERIAVVPPGLDHRGAAAASVPAELQEAPGGLAIARGERPFLLCLGTDFRHKNRVFALRLLGALREGHGWDGALVLAGTHIPHGSSAELERELLEGAPGLAEAVVELGPVSEPGKEWLMANTAAVVYPSVYEGFGLVPFESALRGVPCLFAPRSSLAEVAPAEAAAIVPWDPVQSAARCHAILTDAAARARHVEPLAAAAARLSWSRAAAATVEAYRAAAIAPVRGAALLSRDAVEHERELTAAHETVVDRLIGERAHAQGMYDELNREVGWGLALIGPHGALPEDLQRALLTLSARPRLSRPLYGLIGLAFRLSRVLGRLAGTGSRRRG
jgi:glycosyltransferase involved in cell wall biosynthesis